MGLVGACELDQNAADAVRECIWYKYLQVEREGGRGGEKYGHKTKYFKYTCTQNKKKAATINYCECNQIVFLNAQG